MPTWGHVMSGAPERAFAKARSRSFPFQVKPNGNQYLSLTGGPGVYIAFFGTVFTAVQTHILCAVIFHVLRPVCVVDQYVFEKLSVSKFRKIQMLAHF